MNREHQNFDDLRRLLKLKRYEQPPPRYFNDFSTQVVARLRAGEASAAGETWFGRLWSALELKSLAPAAFGAAICGLLVVGAIYTEKAAVSGELLDRSTQMGSGPTFATAPPFQGSAGVTMASFSTNPIAPAGTLFDMLGPPQSKPAASNPMFR